MSTLYALASVGNLAAFPPVPPPKPRPLRELKPGTVLDAQLLDNQGQPTGGSFTPEKFQALPDGGRLRVNFIHDGQLRKDVRVFRAPANYDGGGYAAYTDDNGQRVIIYLGRDGKILPKGPFTPKPAP